MKESLIIGLFIGVWWMLKYLIDHAKQNDAWIGLAAERIIVWPMVIVIASIALFVFLIGLVIDIFWSVLPFIFLGKMIRHHHHH